MTLLWIYLAFGFSVWLVCISQKQPSNMTKWDYVKQFLMLVLFYPAIAFSAKNYRK